MFNILNSYLNFGVVVLKKSKQKINITINKFKKVFDLLHKIYPSKMKFVLKIFLVNPRPFHRDPTPLCFLVMFVVGQCKCDCCGYVVSSCSACRTPQPGQEQSQSPTQRK